MLTYKFVFLFILLLISFSYTNFGLYNDATHPLCGFRGKHIATLRKITMPFTFGYIHNARTEQVVLYIVDMEYPYNAIIGRGTLNAFEAILHPAYLCMKIPSNQGPIAIHGSQEAARRAKGNWTDSKSIHNIDEAEAHQQHKLLCEDIADQKVLFGS
jgi:cation diffusion facilitator CzcD-associated flavoprotein CzcO